MKKIGIIRHAQSDPTDDGGVLTQEGRNTANQLRAGIGFRLEPIDPAKIKIISSTAGRAVETAEIVAKLLPVPEVTQYACLWVDGESLGDSSEIGALIEEQSAETEVLLVVTHLAVCRDFVRELLRKAGLDRYVKEFYGLKHGTCALIDFGNQTFEIVIM